METDKRGLELIAVIIVTSDSLVDPGTVYRLRLVRRDGGSSSWCIPKSKQKELLIKTGAPSTWGMGNGEQELFGVL